MVGLTYTVIVIYTSEQARWKGVPLHEALTRAVAGEKSAARCLVGRAIGGCYENGEVASHRVLDLSHNMPLKVEIILPTPEAERILARLEEMVPDGVVTVEHRLVRLHRTTGGLLPRGVMVRDVMTPHPTAVTSDSSLAEVASILVKAEFNGVPVVDKHKHVIGIITQGDLVSRGGMRLKPGLLKALKDAGGRADVLSPGFFSDELGSKLAEDVMTRNPVTVEEDARLVDVVKTMKAKRLKRLPVVDGDKRLVGMVARIDIMRLASLSSARRRVLEDYGVEVEVTAPVESVGLVEVPTVPRDTPLSELFELVDNPLQRVVVVDEQGRPVGLISDRELLPVVDERDQRKTSHLSAAAVMQTDIETVSTNTGLENALDLMVGKRLKRLPVVDDRGVFVGMLSREALLRALEPKAE